MDIELVRTNSNEAITHVDLDLSGNYDCPRCGAMNCPVGIYVWYEGEPYGMRYCSSEVCCELMEPRELSAVLLALGPTPEGET